MAKFSVLEAKEGLQAAFGEMGDIYGEVAEAAAQEEGLRLTARQTREAWEKARSAVDVARQKLIALG